jgi:hypothetical protein
MGAPLYKKGAAHIVPLLAYISAPVRLHRRPMPAVSGRRRMVRAFQVAESWLPTVRRT